MGALGDAVVSGGGDASAYAAIDQKRRQNPRPAIARQRRDPCGRRAVAPLRRMEEALCQPADLRRRLRVGEEGVDVDVSLRQPVERQI